MWKALLFIYVMVAIMMFIITIVETKGDLLSVAFTPNEIYDISDCNMVVCVLLYLFWIFVNPFHALYRFLHWITHVERK